MQVMDVRGFVNIHNLRVGHGNIHRHAESKLKALLQPMCVRFEKHVYEVDASHRITELPVDDWRLRRQALERERKTVHYQSHVLTVPIPDKTVGVVCLSRENMCGGLVVTERGASIAPLILRHARIARDLPPGFLVLYPILLTPYELLNPHECGSTTLLWILEDDA